MAEGNKNTNVIIGISILAGIIIMWIAYERNKAYKLVEKGKKKEDELERDNQILFSANSELIEVVHEYEENMTSLKQIIDSSDQIEGEVKRKITDLVDT